MSHKYEKIIINADTNCGFCEETILYNHINNTCDHQTIYDKDGDIIISGSDDFLYKLGCYLVGDDKKDVTIVANGVYKEMKGFENLK